jgi:hypothetical protein
MKNLLIAAFLCIAVTTYAQKVKEKDDIYYVDDQPYVKIGCKKNTMHLNPCPFTTPAGDKNLFSMTPYGYTAIRKVNKATSGPAVWVNEEYTAYFYDVKLLSLDKSFYTKQDLKDLIRLMYNAKLLNNNEYDAAKVDEFIKLNGIEPPTVIR